MIFAIFFLVVYTVASPMKGYKYDSIIHQAESYWEENGLTFDKIKYFAYGQG